MKSLYVHYRNKYPKGRVEMSDSVLNVYNSEGDHCVSLEKNGAGTWTDKSVELGCSHKHDLSPIPKDARLWKMDLSGKIVKDEKFTEREGKMKSFMSEESHVLSCEELSISGKMRFDEKQILKEEK